MKMNENENENEEDSECINDIQTDDELEHDAPNRNGNGSEIVLTAPSSTEQHQTNDNHCKQSKQCLNLKAANYNPFNFRQRKRRRVNTQSQ